MAQRPDPTPPAPGLTAEAADAAMIFGWLDDIDERAMELQEKLNRVMQVTAEMRERLSREEGES